MQQLFERAWPVADPKGAVCIVHGLAEHSGRYEHVARALNQAGYSAFAIDLRGHGNSPGFPGGVGDLDTNIADVVGFVSRVAASHEKTFLLAHSMGTLFALPAVAEMSDETIDGLIVSGCALQSGPAVLESLGTGEGIPAELVSRDPEVVKAYVDDPLVFHDSVPPELLELAPAATQRAGQAIPMIHVPVLILHGTEDQLCDVQGADYLYVQLVVRDKKFQGYRGLYHEILNEPERDQVIGDIVAWLDEH